MRETEHERFLRDMFDRKKAAKTVTKDNQEDVDSSKEDGGFLAQDLKTHVPHTSADLLQGSGYNLVRFRRSLDGKVKTDNKPEE
jgi:hypothetical protein